MTEEEKKEFEEFIQWKKEKDAQKQSFKSNSELKAEQTCETGNDELSESSEQNKTDIAEENPNTTPSDWDNHKKTILFALGVVILILLWLFRTLSAYPPKHSVPQTLDTTIDTEATYVDTAVVPKKTHISQKPSVVTWNIVSNQDEMTDSKNIWAEIKSNNFICQDFPYDGLTYATITVRYMKKYGYDVLIQITKGQIDGRKYYGTDFITARFDNSLPKKYYFNESNDGSSDIVFLRNRTDFINRCKKSKDIKIDIPIYQSGRPVFTFHVDKPLVWPTE